MTPHPSPIHRLTNYFAARHCPAAPPRCFVCKTDGHDTARCPKIAVHYCLRWCQQALAVLRDRRR